MVYQNREIPIIMYRKKDGEIEKFLGRELGWTEVSLERLEKALDDISDFSNFRTISDEDAEETIKKWYG